MNFFFPTAKGFKPKAGLDSLPGSDDDRETADNWSTASVLSDEGVSSIPSEDGMYLKTPPHLLRPHPTHYVLTPPHPYPHDCILWNHLYSWGSMFVGTQNISGLLGLNFVGSVNWDSFN